MESSKLGYQKWLLAAYLLQTSKKGISSVQLAEKLGITQKSAWFLAHRLREALTDSAETLPFTGTVEADETYVGGSDRARHLDKKGKPKTPVVGLKERETNQVRTDVMLEVNRFEVHRWLNGKISDMAALFTDQAACYVGADVALHASVNHRKKQYVDGDVHTNGIESHWALLKRGYGGTYHFWSVKHMQRYLNEFAGRFNLRTLDTIGQLRQIAVAMIGRRLTYSALTA